MSKSNTVPAVVLMTLAGLFCYPTVAASDTVIEASSIKPPELPVTHERHTTTSPRPAADVLLPPTRATSEISADPVATQLKGIPPIYSADGVDPIFVNPKWRPFRRQTIDEALDGNSAVYSGSLTSIGRYTGSMNDPGQAYFKKAIEKFDYQAAELENKFKDTLEFIFVLFRLSLGSVKYFFDLIVIHKGSDNQKHATANYMENVLTTYYSRYNGTKGIFVKDVKCTSIQRIKFAILPSKPLTTESRYIIRYHAYLEDKFKDEYRLESSAPYKKLVARLNKLISYGFWRSAKDMILSSSIHQFMRDLDGKLFVDFYVTFKKRPNTRMTRDFLNQLGKETLLRARLRLRKCEAVEIKYIVAKKSTSETVPSYHINPLCMITSIIMCLAMM